MVKFLRIIKTVVLVVQVVFSMLLLICEQEVLTLMVRVNLLKRIASMYLEVTMATRFLLLYRSYRPYCSSPLDIYVEITLLRIDRVAFGVTYPYETRRYAGTRRNDDPHAAVMNYEVAN